MIAWWFAAAEGAVVLKTGNLCVELQPTFANAIGDHAKVSPPRPAYGLQYEITDAVATYAGYLLDDTGCLDDFPVFAECIGGTLSLGVWARARPHGIDREE